MRKNSRSPAWAWLIGYLAASVAIVVYLVARYGGEEFVVVCEGCTSAEATRLAESIRHELAETPMQELGSERITASFGVTSVEAGVAAEAEEIIHLADKALYEAKEHGRNCVVQLPYSGLRQPESAV